MDVNQHLFFRSQKPITSVFDRLYPAEDEDNKVIIFQYGYESDYNPLE